jgi:hypothetical protein
MIFSDFAIEANEISKLYRLGIKENRHDSLGSTIISYIKSPLKNYLLRLKEELF